jgi:nitrile hydratase subunit beta
VNGVHDLGGMEGLGAVDPTPDEPVFHSDWEKRTFAMFLPFVFTGLNLDQFRHGIERMHPVEYLTGRYYEHWVHTVAQNFVDKGIIDPEELEARTRHYLENPDEPLPDGGDPEQAETFIQIYRTGASTLRDSDTEPQFKVGDRVRVRNINPSGHTRCARYLRGKTGVVETVYGAFVFPDSNSKEEGENPERVYNVRFESSEVWGPTDDGENHVIRFDLWEPYLEAA